MRLKKALLSHNHFTVGVIMSAQNHNITLTFSKVWTVKKLRPINSPDTCTWIRVRSHIVETAATASIGIKKIWSEREGVIPAHNQFS